MQKRLLSFFLIGLTSTSFATLAANEHSTLMETFNHIVANKGKDANNAAADMSIAFQCDEIKQVLSVSGKDGSVHTDVGGTKFVTFMSTPSFPKDMILPDDVSQATGWDYYFRSATGYLTFITKNKGDVKIRVKNYSDGKETEIERPCKVINNV